MNTIIAEVKKENIHDYKSKYDYKVKVIDQVCFFGDEDRYFSYEVWNKDNKLVAKGVMNYFDELEQLPSISNTWSPIEDELTKEVLTGVIYSYWEDIMDKPDLYCMNRVFMMLHKEMDDSSEGMLFIESDHVKEMMQKDQFDAMELLEFQREIVMNGWTEIVEYNDEDTPSDAVITCYGDFRTLFDESKKYTLENQMRYNPFNYNIEENVELGYINAEDKECLKSHERQVEKIINYAQEKKSQTITFNNGKIYCYKEDGSKNSYLTIEQCIEDWKVVIQNDYFIGILSRYDLEDFGCIDLCSTKDKFLLLYERFDQFTFDQCTDDDFFESLEDDSELSSSIENFIELHQANMEQEEIESLYSILNEVRVVPTQSLIFEPQ